MTFLLVIKIGAIGDVVMSLPILPALRKNHPHAHITWVCGFLAAPLVRSTGLVDRLIVVDEKKLLAGSLVEKASQLLLVWKQIGFCFFDQILTLHPDPRYRLLSLFSHSRDRRHWGKRGSRSLPLVGRYHVYEALHLLNSEEGPLPSAFAFPKIKCALKPKWQELIASCQDKPIVVVAPGGAKNTLANDTLRRWPIQSYATLIEELSKQDCAVFVTGSATDEWILPYLPSDRFHCLIGELDLLQTVAFLKKANLLITHDSGPLHLAKLARCQTIGLFGPTNPYSRTAPQEKIHVIWGGEHLSCRPCYNGKTYAPCKRNECLSSISPARVIQIAMGLLPKRVPLNN